MVNQLASGVPFQPPNQEEFKALAIKYKGNAVAISGQLNIIPHTLYSYFKKDPKAKEILDEVRGYNTFTDLDLGEHVNRYNMSNYKENPVLAQKAAEFTLMSKGKERGWIKNQNEDNQSPKEDDIELKQKYYSTLYELQRLKKEIDDLKPQASQELQSSDSPV